MKLPWILAGIIFTAGSASTQVTRRAFEVTSVKVNTQCDAGGRSGGGSSPGQMVLGCADLRDLILTAYGIYGNGANPAPGSFRMQVVGGPAWMDSTRYDIIAKPGGNPPRSEMYGPMLQSLLEDRFGLKVHRETRQGGVYVLTVAKNGPKLRATKEGTCVVADVNHPQQAGDATQVCGKGNTSSNGGIVTVDIPGATIAGLCAQLGLSMDREVVDKTGLAGSFDIHLEVNADDLRPKFVAGRTFEQQDQSTADDAGAGPSISTALQQQLGLKLEPGRGPVQVLVVDQIQRPTGN